MDPSLKTSHNPGIKGFTWTASLNPKLSPMREEPSLLLPSVEAGAQGNVVVAMGRRLLC
jgi:hypothetical protein